MQPDLVSGDSLSFEDVPSKTLRKSLEAAPSRGYPLKTGNRKDCRSRQSLVICSAWFWNGLQQLVDDLVRVHALAVCGEVCENAVPQHGPRH